MTLPDPVAAVRGRTGPSLFAPGCATLGTSTEEDRMVASDPEVTGFTVTVEVFVPAAVAERMVDRLDASWRSESWTPEAAAYMVVRAALESGGLHRSAAVDTQAVTG